MNQFNTRIETANRKLVTELVVLIYQKKICRLKNRKIKGWNISRELEGNNSGGKRNWRRQPEC